MHKQLTFLILAVIVISFKVPAQKEITKIAFGSCGHETHPLPIFDVVVKHNPDYFIFLGDNIYGDTKDMDLLKTKYQKMADKPTFQNLKKNT